MALRFASVSIMLGRIEFARTPVPLKSAAMESIIATAADFDAACSAEDAGNRPRQNRSGLWSHNSMTLKPCKGRIM